MSTPRVPRAPFWRWAAGITFAILAASARADWNPADPAKWVQPPELTHQGMDVRDFLYGTTMSSSFTLADDWQCTVAGPITNIHVWGSWCLDALPPDEHGSVSFILAIHDDIPAGTGGIAYSRPGNVLWTRTFALGDYQVRPYATVPEYEGWFEPGSPGYFFEDGDRICWQYNFPVTTAPFVQRGTLAAPVVYWLEVQAVYPSYSVFKYGWKTSAVHWNDAAVYANQFAPNPGPDWSPLSHPVSGQALDLAFVIQGAPLRRVHKRFFPASVLPPLTGMYAPPVTQTVAFANGILFRNPAHRLFTAAVAPPPTPGASLTHPFGSQVEMEVSTDGGLTWAPHVASGAVQVHIKNSGPDGDDTFYDTEMLQLDIAGGTLPGGVMVRESPTRASAGATRIEAVPGGYMIDSFFDIFTEVSTDGGLTWSPSLQPLSMELKVDPALIPAAAAPRTVQPTPNGQYVSTQPTWQSYANGVVLKDVRNRLFTEWMEPPLYDGSQTHVFDSQLDFQLSLDGGLHWQAGRAPATATVSAANVREFQGQSTYDTEMLQLDVAGGDLPPGVMIRESPTKASQGGTCMLAGGGGGGAGGGAAISSFFDIFTEVSTDGGGSWSPATSGPAREELRRIAPANTYGDNQFPQLQGKYVCQQEWMAYFANGVVIANFVNRSFTAAIPPPPPGMTTPHTFSSEVEMDVSYDGGLTFSHETASAVNAVRLTCRLGGDGVTEYYDTEMSELSLSGGAPPYSVMIRESPTRASQGRTTVSANGLDNDCDSFFDIFIEVSTDGGQNWYPSLAGPATLTLIPLLQGQPLDFGDAPDPTYPTLLASNGPRHGQSTLFLGAQIDVEPDGQPNAGATGDDQNLLYPGVPFPPGDEDGVVFLTPLVPGQLAQVQVTASIAGGWLSAWVDFNADGNWATAGDQIYVAQPLAAGPNILTFPVPPGATPGTSYARFRLHTNQAGIPYFGTPLPYGEVEDYQVQIEPDQVPPDPQSKWWQAPDLTTSGIDVDATSPLLQADDFLCTRRSAITNIVVWGSWKKDLLPPDGPGSPTFFLSIHSDIPAAPGMLFSMPGETLWLMPFPAGSYSVQIERDGLQEGWYNPLAQEYLPWYEPGDTVCYRYTFPVPLGTEFVQTGTVVHPIVYWLDVQAMAGGTGLEQFGWKTSATHWNDDATWAIGDENNHGAWSELRYPAPHPLEGQSIDLAFGLYGGPELPEVTDDFGDAPDPGYPTLLASNGARHTLSPLFLGAQIDAEPDGQPTAGANGDDLAGLPDEDGIGLPGVMVPGGAATFGCLPSGNGFIDAWIDFNADGDWNEAGEQIAASQPVVGGAYNFPFNFVVPIWAVPGPTYARFRLSSTGGLSDSGPAPDGEVEDYLVLIEQEPVPPDPQAKWWQTPDLTTSGIDVSATYPVLQADDFLCTRRSAITNIVVWGSWRKDVLPPEGPGSPTFFLSIHSDIPASEGGLFSMPGETLWLMPFPAGSYSVQIERDGLQEGWYNPLEQEYLKWYEPGDTVCYRYTFPVPLGTEFVQTGTMVHPIVYWLDVQAMVGGTGLEQFGWKTSATHWNDDATWAIGDDFNHGAWSELRYPAPHPLEGQSIDLAFGLYGGPELPEPTEDFGDAPDPLYPTLLASNGARHKLSPLFLGAQIDAEFDGQPTAGANGDDLAGVPDEDGIGLPGVMTPGGASAFGCLPSGNGFIDAWIDFNADGDWSDAGEQIAVSQPVVGGAYNFPFNFIVPGWAVTGPTYARFRLSGTGGLPVTGLASDGEVEDYLVSIGEPLLDFGDAPDSPNVAGYPTLLANNGARHFLRGALYLGALVDSEADGQPTAIADGDDVNGSDDEDGVVFMTPFYRGETAKMQVTVSAAGKLDAWVDLNADSDWNDPGEQMAASLAVTPGGNILAFVVPGTATKGATFARFRLSTNGGLSPAGLADDGEVEDYAVVIEDRFPPRVGAKWLQPPDLAYGIDIQSWRDTQQEYAPFLVADDWWCDGRPIDAIRWWGSYQAYGGVSNAPGIPVGGLRPSGFRLHWYTDVPATNSPTGYSTPGTELLRRDVPLLGYGQPLDAAGEVKEFYAGTVDQSFLGPMHIGQKEHKFRYDLYLEDSWNEKAGQIYWLGIEALYDEGEPRLFQWGWSTTAFLHNWNDDAVVRTNTATGAPVWGEMTYLPKVPPYTTTDTHPYLGRSVNMAYQLLSRVTPRRAYVWRSPPDMVYGTDLDSWRFEPPQAGTYPLRADDWVAEGRRVSDIHWWGSYLNWEHTVGEPVPPPPAGGPSSPLGFNLSWHADGLMQPGAAITNLFVPLEFCHQTYYCCVTQFWQLGVFEHEYQYYVDLLDPRVSGVPWEVVANTRYWLDIQAIFGWGFLPGQMGHAGWGWKTTPEPQGLASVVTTNGLPFRWLQGTYPAGHPWAGKPADLSFELTTDKVGTNRWHAAPNIVAIVIPTNAASTVLVASVGDVSAGEQQLRVETDLTNALFSTAVDYLPVPVPPPWTNWFKTTAATNLTEFYRIYQVDP